MINKATLRNVLVEPTDVGGLGYVAFQHELLIYFFKIIGHYSDACQYTKVKFDFNVLTLFSPILIKTTAQLWSNFLPTSGLIYPTSRRFELLNWYYIVNGIGPSYISPINIIMII